MSEQTIKIRLDESTNFIKVREKAIVSNFYEIGQELKEVRDKQLYKEKYSEFGDYIEQEGFQFSESHGYRMIQIVEEYSRIDTTKIGITKCIALLSLPIEKRQEVLETKPIEEMSVREVREEVQQITQETEKPIPIIEIVEEPQGEVDIFKKVNMLDNALGYLSEELDNVLFGLDKVQREQYIPQYQTNKGYYSTAYQRIEGRLSEVTEKLRKARTLLSQLKRIR